MITVREVHSKAMTLSVSERASLAHDLILSLDNSSDFDLSPAQEAEIQRRVSTVREGSASGRSAVEVFDISPIAFRS